jgi:rubrerythrin
MATHTEQLIREFTEVIGLELEAKDLYESMLPFVSDDSDRERLKSVADDEQKHADIVRNIISILQE